MLAFAAAAFSAALASAAVCRKRRSVATWCFSAGMLTFALESVFTAMERHALLSENAALWRSLAVAARSFLPGIWLWFSLTYSRGNSREFSTKSRFLVLAAFILPLGVFLVFREQLASISPHSESMSNWLISSYAAAKALNAMLLVAAVLVLMNLERTFRSAVGTMRWRIKFIVLGLGIVFGARIYTLSQALLFSKDMLGLTDLDTAALLIGCTLITVAFVRSGFGEIDVYPSHAVLRTSLTVLLAGAYLFTVGVLAQVAAWTGGSTTFQLQAFVVLLGFALLAVLLLSNRVQQKIQRFVSRHFKRPQYDFRQIWMHFTRCTASVLDQSGLCAAAAKLISETLSVLSVTIWLFDEQERLVFTASTSRSEREYSDAVSNVAGLNRNLTNVRELSKPFDLEKAKGDYAENLRQISTSQFRTGGNRVCMPLWTGDHCIGVAILADRVSAVPYTAEELDLLKCMGDQIAVSLLNLRLTEEIMRAKELESFQAISAFFIHDLKNAASTLSLTLQNIPLYFDDPGFRQDALRGIGETATRINQLISRVGALRHLELKPEELDLNLLVDDALEVLKGAPEINVLKELHLRPKLRLDRAQFRSVITNLLLNARDALAADGEVRIQTSQSDGWAIFSVADNGCGMSPAFVKTSLFRPFRTTKKKGLGIGMFQSKMIVEAHRGKIQVESEPGAGTTFRIMLPLGGPAA
jgi:putative PEP-CTERM system histidine kinase